MMAERWTPDFLRVPPFTYKIALQYLSMGHLSNVDGTIFRKVYKNDSESASSRNLTNKMDVCYSTSTGVTYKRKPYTGRTWTGQDVKCF